MSETATDGDLVRRIAARTPDARAAEAELCRRFAPRARLYGLRHLRDEERARDLAQAALLGVLEAARLGRVNDPDRIDRFMLATCRNLASRMREASARERPDSDAIDLAAFLPDTETIETEALVRCLSTLDPRAKLVVHLSFQEDKPAEEIAKVLDTTAGNVRVLRHRAVIQLRRCLDERKEVSE
jgi:RNA polymerase sigma-70 factor, ECF subfamily